MAVHAKKFGQLHQMAQRGWRQRRRRQPQQKNTRTQRLQLGMTSAPTQVHMQTAPGKYWGWIELKWTQRTRSNRIWYFPWRLFPGQLERRALGFHASQTHAGLIWTGTTVRREAQLTSMRHFPRVDWLWGPTIGPSRKTQCGVSNKENSGYLGPLEDRCTTGRGLSTLFHHGPSPNQVHVHLGSMELLNPSPKL